MSENTFKWLAIAPRAAAGRLISRITARQSQINVLNHHWPEGCSSPGIGERCDQ